MIKNLYTHGHALPVLQAHAARTCEQYAAHVVRILRPGDSVLDVGCGPGSITKGFKKYVGPNGRIVGVEVEKKALETAKSFVGNDAEIIEGSIYELPFKDNSFDVVHVHQVLQHLNDPLSALKELKRVSKGVVAAAEVDYESWYWYPDNKGMEDWKRIYRATCRKNNADPDFGRKMKYWFLKAGFLSDLLSTSTTTVTYANRDQVNEISEQWAKRVSETQLGDQMVKYGLATRSQVEDMASGWRTWGKSDDAMTFYTNVAIVARKSI